MEDIIPVLYLAVIVKPVFRKHGQNVIIYDRLHPVIGTSIFRLAAEIAVSDTESFSEGFISPDCSIEFDDLGNEFIEGFVIHCSSIVAEPLGLKSRFEFEKAKPSPQGIINHGQASVCRVHHSDDKGSPERKRACHYRPRSPSYHGSLFQSASTAPQKFDSDCRG